jgi:signal transduction histidine kinase
MMTEDLQRLPREQWPERIRVLAPRFGYDIALLPLAELPLAEEHLRLLRQGGIAVVDEGERLYQQIGDSGLVLKKGPFSVLAPDTTLLNIVVWIGLTVIVALMTLVWIVPYWRKVRRISAAAIAFGDGDFAVRARISHRSSLAPLAHAFNTMADRIEQLIRSHKELTNAVSHELRTPLSRLRFGLAMLEMAENQEKRAHYTRELLTDVVELEGLVSELLTYSRFDRERPELHFAGLPIEPFVEQVLAETVPEDSPIRCHLRHHLDGQSDQPRFEPKYLARALSNLVGNAVNHAESQVQVGIERSGEDCVIHVDDDGPGIPVADRERVLAPFTRLDASRSRASGGYGLGLAIVARILEWHGGRVAIADAPLGGARVTLTWPGYGREEEERSAAKMAPAAD